MTSQFTDSQELTSFSRHAIECQLTKESVNTLATIDRLSIEWQSSGNEAFMEILTESESSVDRVSIDILIEFNQDVNQRLIEDLSRVSIGT